MTARFVGHIGRDRIDQGTLKRLAKTGYPAEMVNSGNALIRSLGNPPPSGELWQRASASPAAPSDTTSGGAVPLPWRFPFRNGTDPAHEEDE